MKIDKNFIKNYSKEVKTRPMYFSDLENGDLFQTVDGELYVRISTISGEWDEYNAVNIADGTVHYFYEDTEVAKYVEYIKLTPQAFVNIVPIS